MKIKKNYYLLIILKTDKEAVIYIILFNLIFKKKLNNTDIWRLQR